MMASIIENNDNVDKIKGLEGVEGVEISKVSRSLATRLLPRGCQTKKIRNVTNT